MWAAELQVARISFASGNNDLFRQSLQRALDEIEIYFDLETAAVAAAVSTLQEIQATELPEAMPDISGSMALLLASAEEGR